MSRRTERIASAMRQELAEILQREVHDPRLEGILSITRIKVSEDLGVADVYVTMLGTPGQQKAAVEALRRSAGMMRSRLTKSMSMRTIPQLRFHLDEKLKQQIEVMGLLEKVRQEHEELDRKRAAGDAPPLDN